MMLSTASTKKEVKKAMQVRISMEDWKRLKKVMHREELDSLKETVHYLLDFYEQNKGGAGR